jgi:cytochrome c oxidase subunit 4
MTMSDSTKGHHHILPLKVYLTIGAVLLLATAVTVIVAQFDFGPFNLLVAMLIAATKATLVALYFMHLKYDHKLYMFVFVGGALFLAVFIVLTMFDTQRRDDLESIVARPISDQAVIYQQSDNSMDTVTAETGAVTSDSISTDSADGQ